MSDACSTKNALAKALRELMSELPFEKITISQICERCNINRKSFYYHFKDKYDLVNWIFDMDLVALTKKARLTSGNPPKLSVRICMRTTGFTEKPFRLKGRILFPNIFMTSSTHCSILN